MRECHEASGLNEQNEHGYARRLSTRLVLCRFPLVGEIWVSAPDR